ncbi:MAG: hypothetical protein KBC33_02345 [Candidatus Pacebacteria bacterium]|nr:hypothetical protein [Candidatus Paceibacterota bacterium]
MKMKYSLAAIKMTAAVALSIAATYLASAQITLPNPNTLNDHPVWRNVTPFSGQFPDSNGWTLYGSPSYPYMPIYGLTSSHAYTNFPVVDVGPCMFFCPSGEYWSGASQLVTNHYDGSGNPITNRIAIYVFGGQDWNVLGTTTNDVYLFDADLGDAPATAIWAYMISTNWHRLVATIPPIAATNTVVKITLRIPYQGITYYSAYPVGYYMPDNSGQLGGVTWDPVWPVTPPTLDVPESVGLAIVMSNDVVQVSWPQSLNLFTLQTSGLPTGTFTNTPYSGSTTTVGTNTYVFTRFTASDQQKYFRLTQ